MPSDEETTSSLPDFFADGNTAISRQEYAQALTIFRNGLKEAISSDSENEKLWVAFYATAELLAYRLQNSFGENWEERIPKRTIIASDLTCSFCGKREADGIQLIAGANAYICNGCVSLCNEILAEQNQINP